MTAEIPAEDFNYSEEEDLEQYSTNELIVMIQGILGENYDVSTLSRNELIRTLESLKKIKPEPMPISVPVPVPVTKPESAKEVVEEPERPVKKQWWQTGQYE